MRAPSFDSIDEDEFSLHNLDGYGRNVAAAGNYRPYDDFGGKRYFLEHKFLPLIQQQQQQQQLRIPTHYSANGNIQTIDNVQSHQMAPKRAIDSIGGANLLKRAVDRLGGGNLLRHR